MSVWRMPWNRSLGPIGLDLGAEHPRAMQVRHGPDAPVAMAEVRTAPDADLATRAKAMVAALRRGGFSGRDVVVGLPSSVARMHVARLPALEGADGREAIAWEASERNAIARDALVADALATGAPVAHGDQKEEQLVMAAPIDELEGAFEVLLDAGFDPVAAEPRFVAVARGLSRRARRDADASLVRAVLHVDGTGSCIMVLRGDRIAFCREVPVGGETLDQAVATRLAVPVEAAAVLRAHRIAAARGQAPEVDSVAEEAAAAATRATLDALAGEVALCLRYYGVTFRGGQPGRVVLSGPHGAEPKLAQIIAATTRAEVVWCAEELPAGVQDAALRRGGSGMDAWMAAFGLACRSREQAMGRRAKGARKGVAA